MLELFLADILRPLSSAPCMFEDIAGEAASMQPDNAEILSVPQALLTAFRSAIGVINMFDKVMCFAQERWSQTVEDIAGFGRSWIVVKVKDEKC